MTSSSTGMDKLAFVIDLLVQENDKLYNLMREKELKECDPLIAFLQQHRNTLIEVITQLRDVKVNGRLIICNLIV